METVQESEEEPKFGDLTCKDFYNLSRHFVRKYYQTLHSAPNFLYKFYGEKGRLCHLKSEETIIKYFVGIRQIKEELKKKETDHIKIVVERIDHQPFQSDPNTPSVINVLICVHGYMFINNPSPGERFSQTFILTRNQKNFFVVANDILRFLPHTYVPPDGVTSNGPEDQNTEIVLKHPGSRDYVLPPGRVGRENMMANHPNIGHLQPHPQSGHHHPSQIVHHKHPGATHLIPSQHHQISAHLQHQRQMAPPDGYVATAHQVENMGQVSQSGHIQGMQHRQRRDNTRMPKHGPASRIAKHQNIENEMQGMQRNAHGQGNANTGRQNEKMKINGLQGAVGPPGINRAQPSSHDKYDGHSSSHLVASPGGIISSEHSSSQAQEHQGQGDLSWSTVAAKNNSQGSPYTSERKPHVTKFNVQGKFHAKV